MENNTGLGAKSRRFQLESVEEEDDEAADDLIRPNTSPETNSILNNISIMRRQTGPDLSSLFTVSQLTGRQISWCSVRLALAELFRPSTLVEIGAAVWRMYQDYCLFWRLSPVMRVKNFDEKLVKIVNKYYDCLRVEGVGGGDDDKVEYLWLMSEFWPSNKERSCWRKYRTVHQAVRTAVQEIVDSGVMFTGLFSQIKFVHEFVEENSVFSKKQVREVLADLQPQLRTTFKPGDGGLSSSRRSRLRKSQSLESVPSQLENKIPWNYGIGGGRNKMLATGMKKKQVRDVRENVKFHGDGGECSTKSSSLLDIADLSKLIDYRQRVPNNYLDV